MTNYDEKKFTELTGTEVHEIFYERVKVFVVEQNCPYQEVDDTDLDSWHNRILDENGKLLAYIRVYEENGTVHFGRVLVIKEKRKDGLGKELVQQTLSFIERNYPNLPIEIGAQAYLESFYRSFGFEPISEVYLEDDIPHIDMRLTTAHE